MSDKQDRLFIAAMTEARQYFARHHARDEAEKQRAARIRDETLAREKQERLARLRASRP